jgi:hypothetical protein
MRLSEGFLLRLSWAAELPAGSSQMITIYNGILDRRVENVIQEMI